MAAMFRPRAARRSAQPVDSTIAALEEDRYRPAREHRRMFEQDWLLQIAFYLGHQWVNVDGSGRVTGGAQELSDRVMLTDNRIRPAVRSTIAKQTKSTPTWVGIPRGASDEEIQRARMRSIVFEHYWRQLEGRRKYRLALWWREVTGAGLLKQTWDSTLGNGAKVMAVKGGPVLLDSYGGPITPERVGQVPEETRSQHELEERTVTFGEPVLEVVTPWNAAVDPLATDEGLSSAEYIVQDGIYSPAYLARRFGADPEKLEADADGSAGVFESRFPQMTAYLGSRQERGAAGRRGIRTREYWSRPGVDDGKAKHVVYTVGGGGEVLLEEISPYPFLPYAMFSGPPSGRFWPDAPIKDGISPQTEKNKTISQIAENAERFGNPARARSVESLEQGSDWQGLPGEEVIYHVLTGGEADIPGFITPPEMPAYVQNRLTQIDDSLNATLNQATVSQGEVPQGVTAASAINLLLEASNTVLGDDIKEGLSGLLDVGRMLLWQVRKFAHDDRLAQIAGEDSHFDVYSFTGEALGDCSGDEIDIGSEQAQSVAAKQAGIQFVLNLLIQNGQAPSPRELRRVLRDYEVGGLEHFFASISRDQAQVVDETRRMLRGEAVPINTFDDDSIHIDEHQDFQKSSRWRELAKRPGGQIIQARYEAHVQAHRDRAQQAATAAATAAAAQKALETGQPGPDPAMVPGGPVLGAGGGTPEGALPSTEVSLSS